MTTSRAPLAEDYAPTPWWWDDVAPRTARVAALPAGTEVVVVGAGLTGLATAYELGAAGVDVVVVDAEVAGAGASSRNGGMAHPGSKLDLASLLARPGGRVLWDDMVGAFEGLDAFARELGIQCSFCRCGHVELAHHPRVGAHLARLADAYVSVGEEVDLLDRTAIRSEVGSGSFLGGLVVHRSASLHPARLASGLVAAAEAAGARIHDHTRATGIERRSGGVLVRTNRGPILARDVVVATDGTTDGTLAPWLGRRILGVDSYMVATEELDRALVASAVPAGRMLFDTRNFLHYWRASPDGRRLLFGGRTSFAPTTLEAARDRLYRALVAIHPQLTGTRVARAWGGRVGLTADRLPHLGRLPDSGALYAMGYCGTGVVLSVHFGRAVGRWLAGRGELPPFATGRWPALPPPARLPALLPVAGLWYQALDRLGR